MAVDFGCFLDIGIRSRNIDRHEMWLRNTPGRGHKIFNQVGLGMLEIDGPRIAVCGAAEISTVPGAIGRFVRLLSWRAMLEKSGVGIASNRIRRATIQWAACWS